MNKSFEWKQSQGAGIRQLRLALVTLLAAAMLLISACSNADNSFKNNKNATGATNSASAAPTAPASDVPAVLNYGFIGSNELNVPGGAEGWGLYKGIIQEELKKYGITEVKLTAFPNGPDQTESLISGRLDFGSLGDTPAIIAYASGAKTRLISQPAARQIGYLIGKKNGPKTLKDLEGQTISIQKGSFMHRYVVGLLQEAGVTDYKLVHMLTPDATAALARGDVAAMTNTGVPALKQIDEGFVHLDDASTHPNLLGTSVTVVSEAYLAKFPDFPKVWNEAREKALADLKQHEAEYYEFLAKINKTTPELAKQIFPISDIIETAFSDDGLALLEGTKGFLVKEGLAKKDFNISDWQLQ
ncbi:MULTISPECIES: ABC transporter substrate-binding protein [unclassified Paenibacillus]|uniref:ABC transporter substrate-binding protein n=1 Tax=unclassified Paenibacillus TaxID=185978 RepID=UPI0024072F74|nr:MULTISPECIES: ABC transporter substrate-binding protein [unclassified Paenibacillus]MDF9844571.1 sulfonate transport system substrate-binding protein [Paenibacillus sp. PastF-2]MDF9851144.1 sulfonate transport system substrate-binding protein [Paenibacillus sp. PastM-2]MDF9856221.1 sulfonate transport system substrate-binding protein [Paenibacillus sp. PastF-1]MDH6481550.1 sulfonate transport system substrate-binding protein [Paenibacillus sp. PastH-2]MDH6510436.1 sulfonate transport system